MVLVSRHADVKDVIRRDDTSFSVRAKVDEGSRYAARRALWEADLTAEQRRNVEEFIAFQGRVMSRNDGEIHTRLRAVAHRALTPRAVAESHETIRRFVEELLEPMAQEDVSDLREFALLLPLRVVATMLTIPWDDGVVAEASTINRVVEDAPSLLRGYEVMQHYRGYGEELVQRYQQDPASVPALAAAIFDARLEQRLTADEHTAMLLNLIFAGHETTMNLITLGMLELLRRRDQWQLLCEDPSLASRAVDELLRWVTPVQWLNRVAIEDVEIGGTHVAAGTTVAAIAAAGNRDPEVFSKPEELDILEEDRAKHLGLGFGPHFCVGASLAKAEATIAFELLARHFPEIELAVDEPEWAGNTTVRTVKSLPVALGRRRR
jgi:cytochrome P450